MKMEREDIRVLPLALLGLAKGLGEVIIKPFMVDQTEKVMRVTKAAISYYHTPEAEGQADDAV